jgi:hypothetical protein
VLWDGGGSREDRLTCVRIQNVIKSIHALPDSWVRLERVRRMPHQLELSFGVHKEGRPKKKFGAWTVLCDGVQEASISDFDGGGLAVYSTTHPAARQYRVRSAELKWSDAEEEAIVLGVLYQAHTDAVDDWIPFDRCVRSDQLSESKWSCSGPEFLLRAYAKALRANLIQPRLILRRQLKKRSRPLKVLHFGASFVVAESFIAERLT